MEAVLLMVELFEQLMPVFAQMLPAEQQTWAHLLTQMLVCQEAQNWLELANFLQYELPELPGEPV